MKKMKPVLMAFFLTFCSTLQAQQTNGISVETQGDDIVVLMNDQEICGPTQSCFIANLTAGNYRISVYRADEMDLHATRRDQLYYEKVRYSGQGVYKIKVANGQRHYEDQHNYGPRYRDVMDDRAFRDYIHALKEATFDDDKIKIIDLLPAYTQFTSQQCYEIAKLFTYDQNKVQILKELYPRVVDKEKFYVAIDALTYHSYKEELTDYVKKYNRHYR